MGLSTATDSSTSPGIRGSVQNGLLGRGVIVSVQATAVTVSTGPDFDPAHVCVFTVEVALDDVPQYSATCHQAVRGADLHKLLAPGATVAVRVDPADHSHIALSLDESAPTVKTPTLEDLSTGPAARIKRHGLPCTAVINHSQSLGMRASAGFDMYVLVLTVLADGEPPYQARVGSPVPAAALPLIFPGNSVPARRMPDGGDHEIVIDWQAALAEAARTIA